MHIKAKDTLFVRGREPSEYVQPGDVVELEDSKAQLLIDRGVAEAATKAEAAKTAKQDGGS